MVAGKIIPAIATATASVTGLVVIELLKLLQLGPLPEKGGEGGGGGGGDGDESRQEGGVSGGGGGGKQLPAFKNASNNLGVNGYFFSEPMTPAAAKDEYDPIMMEEVKCRPAGFTKWDKTVVNKGTGRDLSLEQFRAAFSEATGGLVCVDLYHGMAEDPKSDFSGKYIYQRDAWKASLKAVYAERLPQSLRASIDATYGGTAVKDTEAYARLEVACEDSDGNSFKVPTVVYYFGDAGAGGGGGDAAMSPREGSTAPMETD